MPDLDLIKQGVRDRRGRFARGLAELSFQLEGEMPLQTRCRCSEA